MSNYENDVIDYMTGQSNPDLKAWDGVQNLPDVGDHLVRIAEAGQEVSKNKNPQLVLTFEVVKGENEGRRIRGYYILKDEDVFNRRLKQVREAAGVAVINGSGAFRKSDFVGKTLLVEVYEDSYEVPDAVTGATIKKTSKKVRNERKAG